MVFLRCSVHDVRTVSTTLNLMSTWLSSLLQRMIDDERAAAEIAPISQPLLRSTFDFAFFFQGMLMILDSEHAQILLKGVEFLYRHWDLLPETQAVLGRISNVTQVCVRARGAAAAALSRENCESETPLAPWRGVRSRSPSRP